jgi:O-antigen/teichoic acid export membrane protein
VSSRPDDDRSVPGDFGVGSGDREAIRSSVNANVAHAADAPSPPPDGHDVAFASASSIGTRAARGAINLIVRNGIVQSLQIVSSLVLARTLTPSSYGAFAVASTLVGLGASVGDLGLGQSLVMHEKCDEQDLSASAAVVITTTVVLVVVLGLAGVAIHGTLLSASSPPLLTAAYAGTLLPTALQVTPLVRLRRALKFREIGVITTTSVVTGYVVQVLLLLSGVGVWALVLGVYANVIVGLVVAVRLGGRIARPRFGDRLRSLVMDGLPYQGPIILSGAIGLILPLIVVTVFGQHRLGLWAWATILAAPVVAITSIIQSVLAPTLARLHGQYREQFAIASDRAARLIALIAAGAAAALVGLAPQIVRQVFGARWVGATGAVQVALVGIIPMAFMQFLSAVVVVRERAPARFRCAIIATVVTLAVLYPLLRVAGVTGAALASEFIFPVVDCLLLARYAEAPLSRAAANVVGVAIVTGAISVALNQFATTPWTLAVMSIATGLATLGVVWTMDRTTLVYAWSLLNDPRRALRGPSMIRRG